VVVYRADKPDLTRFQRLLARSGLPVELERYGAGVVYVVVNSTSPDLVTLATSAGPSVRQVLDLDQLR
jgi:hypothetical protein